MNASPPRCQPIAEPVRLSDRERKALEALADAGGPEGGYLGFAGVASRSGLDPKVVRRTVRALARKGLAAYGKGLWNDDGEPAGSGYCATDRGLEIAQLPADRAQP